MTWDILAGLGFGSIIIGLFLLAHLVGVVILWHDQQPAELTPEQEAMLGLLMDQPL